MARPVLIGGDRVTVSELYPSSLYTQHSASIARGDLEQPPARTQPGASGRTVFGEPGLHGVPQGSRDRKELEPRTPEVRPPHAELPFELSYKLGMCM